jgi:hypothetical protein
LLLRRTQRIKPFDYLLGLRRHATAQQTAEQATVRGMRANRVQQVGSAAVMKEKQTLPQASGQVQVPWVPNGH